MMQIILNIAIIAAIAYIWVSMRHHRHLFYLLDGIVKTHRESIEKLTDNGSLCETCSRAKMCKSKPMRPNVH